MTLRLITTFAIGSTAALLAGCGSSAGPAEDAAFPAGTMTVVVPFSPGGPTDLAVRSMAPLIEERTGQTVVTENKPGATGTIGMNYVIGAKPDGLTSAIACTSSAVVVPLTQENPPYATADYRTVGSVTAGPIAFLVNKDSEYDDIGELLAAAEASPDTLTAGTSGANSHNSLELKRLADLHGASFTEVPFEGNSAATAALLAGDIDVAFISVADDIPQYMEEGSLRMLAVASAERSTAEALEDVPTLAESGYSDMVNGSSACGIVVPAETPDDIVDAYSGILGEVTADPEFREAVGEDRVTDPYLPGDEMTAFFENQLEAYEGLVDGGAGN
ncbi:tripartite tricarboxylate transporter substrate binding protein [Brevibacterium album]|uniref:tripartite tricarboxylate transporter substrate binding protein n=1 Tax=Brevibacterium album TaxID=417948 RepID=UPI00040F99F8|nr:tripartite tricarboxylate transporter substrate binding protein [Brevibacterium album]